MRHPKELPYEEKIVACARAAYEANRAYCVVLGDDSFGPWEDAPDWQQKTCILGVEGALSGNTPEESHEGWLDNKVAEGWVYGEIKDPEKKTHPCMLPYSQLPPAQRLKDLLYTQTVLAMGTVLGLYNPITKEPIRAPAKP